MSCYLNRHRRELILLLSTEREVLQHYWAQADFFSWKWICPPPAIDTKVGLSLPEDYDVIDVSVLVSSNHNFGRQSHLFDMSLSLIKAKFPFDWSLVKAQPQSSSEFIWATFHPRKWQIPLQYPMILRSILLISTRSQGSIFQAPAWGRILIIMRNQTTGLTHEQ